MVSNNHAGCNKHQGPRSKFELTGAKISWLVENEDKVSKSSEKVHSKTKMAEN